MASATSTEMNSVGNSSDRQDSSLHSHLALGLHAFAQPLAILRAKLYLESIARMDAVELQRLAVDSAAQVERLCTLFNYLQEIVLAETGEPKLSSFPLRDVLESVVDGVDLWFRDAGITLALHFEQPSDIIFADKARLTQAISSLAVLMHGLSKSGDTVTFTAIPEGDSTEIRFANGKSEGTSLDAETRLRLALIETNVRKQRGAFLLQADPLEFRLRVPNAPITT